MKYFQIKKKSIVIGVILCLMIGINLINPEITDAKKHQSSNEEFVIHMVTGEFKTTTEDGREIEAYRWDPGTIFVPKGMDVTLSIYGVNGKEHPFYIEGTDVTGTVKKGEETRVKLRFDEEGIYRIICKTHEKIENDGPMIGYIVVKK